MSLKTVDVVKENQVLRIKNFKNKPFFGFKIVISMMLRQTMMKLMENILNLSCLSGGIQIFRCSDISTRIVYSSGTKTSLQLETRKRWNQFLKVWKLWNLGALNGKTWHVSKKKVSLELDSTLSQSKSSSLGQVSLLWKFELNWMSGCWKKLESEE